MNHYNIILILVDKAIKVVWVLCFLRDKNFLKTRRFAANKIKTLRIKIIEKP